MDTAVRGALDELPFVLVDDVYKRYGNLEVLRGVRLAVEKGSVVVLIGPSGSGKSTLLRCIHSLESIESGEIYIDGIQSGYHVRRDGKLARDSRSALNTKRSEIGMVFQHFDLFSHLTALQNVTLALRSVKKLEKKRAVALARERLAEMGLGDKADCYPAHLSGGQKQRVGIARALAMHPKLMLFDEPTSALDPELVGEILDIMKRLALTGMTMIVVTHEVSFARDVADRVCFLAEGQVVEEAAPSALFENPKCEVTKKFLRSVLQQSRVET